MQAVVLHTDDHWLVMVGETCRGQFICKADAQLWALHLLDAECIDSAVMASGLVISHNR